MSFGLGDVFGEYQDESSGNNFKTYPFRVKCGSETEIVFLDDLEDAIPFYQHKIVPNPDDPQGYKQAREFTCLDNSKSGDDCILCQWARLNGRGRRRVRYVMNVLDTEGYTKADGEEVPWVVRPFLFDKDALVTLKMYRGALAKQGLDMKGARYKVARPKAKNSPRIGTTYLYDSHVKDLSPYELLDFAEIYKADEEAAKAFIESFSTLPGAVAAGASPKDIPFD